MSAVTTDIFSEGHIDSRDLIELRDDCRAELDENPTTDDADELRAAIETVDEIERETESYAGDSMRDGIFFIARRDFAEYAQELASDIGAINKDASWPLSHIDWQAAADELEMDYTSISIHGTEYLYR